MRAGHGDQPGADRTARCLSSLQSSAYSRGYPAGEYSGIRRSAGAATPRSAGGAPGLSVLRRNDPPDRPQVPPLRRVSPRSSGRRGRRKAAPRAGFAGGRLGGSGVFAACIAVGQLLAVLDLRDGADSGGGGPIWFPRSGPGRARFWRSWRLRSPWPCFSFIWARELPSA